MKWKVSLDAHIIYTLIVKLVNPFHNKCNSKTNKNWTFNLKL